MAVLAATARIPPDGQGERVKVLAARIAGRWQQPQAGPYPVARAPATVADRGAIMTSDPRNSYPEHLLAREPAPPYAGEGPFALWHFSEDPSLGFFQPRPTVSAPDGPPLVWAGDTRHAPMFWFPRDCPRGCVWPVSTTTAADRERFFGQSAAPRVHVIEGGWLDRVLACRLYAYRLPDGAFAPHPVVGGYWVTDQPVEAIERVTVDDLLGWHAAAGIELRIAPSIWPFWRRVTASTVEFSGSRLRNAADHPERIA